MQQMRGGFSSELQDLRSKLIKFASLIELELDFSQEDVTFADKDALQTLIKALRSHIQKLMDSFALGNAIRNGVPVAIVGKPNAGKSTLLNALLNEERAIVSDIPGTTRDTIEEELVLNGVSFRFIDTAGIRGTGDTIENLGIERSYNAIRKAAVVIYLFDVKGMTQLQLQADLAALAVHLDASTKLVLVGNKIDQTDAADYANALAGFEVPQHAHEILFISSKNKSGLDTLLAALSSFVDLNQVDANSSVVSNARHLDALGKAAESLTRVASGLEQDLSGDLLASDIRQALYYIGTITGHVSVEDLLDSIFRDFCIGK
jgi:tRNA modification GTPase